MFTKYEIEVLQTLWREGTALTKQEIIELTPDKTWKPATADYILKSLINKKAVDVVGYKKSGVKHYARTFRAIITQEEYAASHISEVMPGVSFAGIFSALVGRGNISEETIHDLKQMLDELEKSGEAEG